MGKIIDAEFGQRGHDRYCAACHERYPRTSTLCPRCGGALVLWATHAATDQRKRRRQQIAGLLGLVLTGIFLLIAILLRA